MAKAVLPCVLALAAALTGAATPTQSGHDLFQQALLKERAEGKFPSTQLDLELRIEVAGAPGRHPGSPATAPIVG